MVIGALQNKHSLPRRKSALHPHIRTIVRPKTMEEEVMAAAHVLLAVRRNVLPKVVVDALPDAAFKALYFSLTAAAFVFVSFVLTGIVP